MITDFILLYQAGNNSLTNLSIFRMLTSLKLFFDHEFFIVDIRIK